MIKIVLEHSTGVNVLSYSLGYKVLKELNTKFIFTNDCTIATGRQTIQNWHCTMKFCSKKEDYNKTDLDEIIVFQKQMATFHFTTRQSPPKQDGLHLQLH